MKQINRISFLSSLATAMATCSIIVGLNACSSNDTPAVPDKPVATDPLQIKINATATETRVSDSSFDQGDKVGIYVVNYNGNTPGTLKSTGNHVDNMLFTFNGSWDSATPIYWKDNETHADFYLYYPYRANIASVNAIPFEVKSDQSNEQNYKSSELLTGSSKNVAPTENAVNINARHLMSQINIILEAGDGFKEEDLTSDNISVRINDVCTHCTLNLATGATTPTDLPTTVTPGMKNNVYRALLPPQTVAETNLITVTADGRDFNLRKAFTFESGKVHKFTVRFNKTSNGVNVGITPWENDGTDNGGIAE